MDALLSWFYLILGAVGYVISGLAALFSTREDEYTKSLLSIFSNFLTTGLILYSGLCFFDYSVMKITYSVLVVLSFSLLTYVIYKYLSDSFANRLILRIAACFIITVFILVIFLDFYGLSEFSNLSDKLFNFESIVTNFITIVTVIVTTLILSYLNYINRLSSRKRIKELEAITSELEIVIHKIYESYLHEYNEYDGRISSAQMQMCLYKLERNFDIFEVLPHYIIRNIEKFISEINNRETKYSFGEFYDLLMYGQAHQGNLSSYPIESSYLIENMIDKIQRMIQLKFEDEKYFTRRALDDISIKIDNIVSIKNQTSRNQTSRKKDQDSIYQDSNFKQQGLIKELYHYLMTPISQIHASLLTLEIACGKDNETLSRAKSGLDLIKAVLAAYRLLLYYGYNDKDDGKMTINKGISSAISLYKNMGNHDIKDYSIPEAIDGYNSNFVIAILLPLIENAVSYAAPESKGEIVVKYELVENNHIFKISNPINNLNIDDLYTEGYSSKIDNGEAHQGMGLFIVRRLISSIDDSQLTFEKNVNILTTTLQI